VEVRSCTECELAVLRELVPTVDDVAGQHYEQQRAATATFLVCWDGDDPLGWDSSSGVVASASMPGRLSLRASS